MHRGACRKHKSMSANRSFRHYLNDAMVSQRDPSLSSNFRAKPFTWSKTEEHVRLAVAGRRMAVDGDGVAAEQAWARVHRCMASAWPTVACSGLATHMHGAWRRSSCGGDTTAAAVTGKRAQEGRRELGKEVPRSAWSGGAQRRGGTAALQAQWRRRTEQATPAARRLYVMWGRRRKERGTSGMAG